MALSQEDQHELDELVAVRNKKMKAAAAAKREADVAVLQLRAWMRQHGLTKITTSTGYVVSLVEIANYREIDAALVEHDFPRKHYPELYTPEYSVLKRLVNERVGASKVSSTAAVSKYLGFSQRLYVTRSRKRKKS